MIEPDAPGTAPKETPGASGASNIPVSAPGHGDVAHVLRKAFQAAVDETVPDEMLDLLAKLS